MVDIRWRYHLTCLAFSQRRGDVHRDFTSVGDSRPVLPCGTRSCGQGRKPRETCVTFVRKKEGIMCFEEMSSQAMDKLRVIGFIPIPRRRVRLADTRSQVFGSRHAN
ncbi:hypothetical protein G5I_11590 [Acromyrmex echinatior]|uniref:Uncharacterized protein n=1 Tax=Acromyrmex echinatior TaxID=103372 RepID=F4X008_ACREC|nr:hypothetical protein G5I_11590 [Acromyrmex echinatior]